MRQVPVLLGEKRPPSDYRRALKLLHMLHRNFPKYLSFLEYIGYAYWGLGIKTRNNKNKRKLYRKAITYFDKVIKSGKKSVHIKHCKRNKWQLLLELKELKILNNDFFQYATLILKEEPKNAGALRASMVYFWTSAESMEKKKKYSNAIKYYKLALMHHDKYCQKKKCETKADILYRIGFCHQSKSKLLGALHFFEKALKLKPNWIEVMIARFQLLVELKRYSKSLQNLHQLQRIDKRNRLRYLKIKRLLLRKIKNG